MTASVELIDISKTYEGSRTPAVSGVSLAIEERDITAIMGPSGGGKSTLLNLIGALDRPSAGAVTVAGQRVERLSESAAARFRRANVGLIFQFFHLLDDLPVIDNVAIPASLAGVGSADARARAGQLLDQLGLGEVANRYPATLSGGQRQRVAIARAVINRPAVLLADEPTGALDSVNGAAVLGLFAELNRAGQTIVLVTHDPYLAERVAHRTVQLIDGRIADDSAQKAAA
jgi:putative ABC transport system ATP-binding protein